MKNLKKLMGLMVAGVLALGFNTNVRAETIDFDSQDLTSKYKASDYIGNKTKFNVSFDNTRNITVLDVTTTLDNATIENIFNHHPGNSNSPAQIGTLYFDLDPGLDAGDYKKYAKTFTDDASLKTAKQDLDDNISNERSVNYDNIYLGQITIYYKSGNGFVALNGEARGNETNGTALAGKFGKSSYTELEYGKDYTFGAYKTRSFLVGWQKDGETEYMIVNIKIDFPVEIEDTTSGTVEHYFPTLDQALKSQLINTKKVVNVNNDTVISTDTEIPAGVTVNVDGTLTVKSGAKLTVKGNLKVDAEDIVLEDGADIDATEGDLSNTSGDTLYVNDVKEFENGSITLSPKFAKKGDTVTITVTPNDGYKLKEGSLKITKKAVASAISTIALPIAEDNEIPITGYTFTMPDGEVEVTAEFEKVEEKIKITLDIDGDVKENYEVTKGWTLQDLLNDLKNKGYSITGFTNKDGEELELSSEITEGMYLVAVLEDEVVTEAPQTLDNILKFVGIGVLGLGTLGVAAKKYLC